MINLKLNCRLEIQNWERASRGEKFFTNANEEGKEEEFSEI